MKEKKRLATKTGRRLCRVAICCALCLGLLPWGGLGTTVVEALEAREGEPAWKDLEGFTALNGSWTFGDTVTSSSSGGDIFALSDASASRFVLEADVAFKKHAGAASLVFFSGDDPLAGAFVANLDLSNGNARIFAFGEYGQYAGDYGAYTLPTELKRQSEFHLRVESDGRDLIYSINGTPVIAVDFTPVLLEELSEVHHGQRLGLLTFGTEVHYSNVRYCSPDDLPTLTDVGGLGIPFEGAAVTTVRLARDTKTLTLTPVSSSGATVTAHAVGATVTTEGDTLRVSEYSGDFTVYLQVTRAGAGRTYALRFDVEPEPAVMMEQAWRPQLHFTPQEKGMNDPNGLVYDPSDGRWHLFYQYNPMGQTKVWGHAVSEDLMHWEELDIAIPLDALGMVFSGSAVVDEENTSGFFTDNKPGESKLVALFTSHGGDTTHGTQKQSIAYSKDHGVTWIRPSLEVHGFENPILPNDNDKYGAFRDPKIFRYDGRWFMVIAGGHARLFVSDDLIHWTHAGNLGLESECPDLYPLAVDGDSNSIKWVYVASGQWYVVGDLVKAENGRYTFVAEGERLPYNGGDQVYATQSFYNDGTGAGRRIAMSWIMDSAGPELLPGKSWYGALTLPYEQTLCTVNGQLLLCSAPVAELESLYGDTLLDLDEPTVEEAAAALEAHPCELYELSLVLRPAEDGLLTLTLCQGGRVSTTLIYDAATATLRVVRDKSSVKKGLPDTDMVQSLRPRANGTAELRVIMDRTVLEVFGNGGEAALCGNIYPTGEAINHSMSVEGGVELRSLRLTALTSMWEREEEPETPPETEAPPETAPVTDPATDTPTDTPTEPMTDASTVADTLPDTVPVEAGGCASAVGAASLLLTVAGAAWVHKRKHEG